MKKQRKILVSSMIMILTCCLLFAGSTFAWFSDSVSSNNNVITAGNLDVEVEYTLDGQTWADLAGADDLFQKSLWEPGHTEVVVLRIKNNGSLALKYKANLNIAEEVIGKTKDGKDIKLSKFLTVKTLTFADAGVDPLFGFNIAEKTIASAFEKENNIAYGETAPFSPVNEIDSDESLLPGDVYYIAIEIDMPETVGNEANHDGVHVPSISFGIEVIAAQLNSEEDSFGSDYDKVTAVSNEAELLAAVAAGGDVMLAKDIVVTDATATVNKGVKTNLYLNGKTISATSTIADKNKDGKFNASDNYQIFLVNAGGQLNIIGDGEINVAYTNTNLEWNAMTTIAHAYGDVNVSNGAVLKNLGGTDMAFALNVYSGGNITVEDSFIGSTYCAIRAFSAQAGAKSVVDIKNSSLVSFNWNRAFWAQYYYDLEVKGVLTEAEAQEAGNTIYGSVRHAGMSSSSLWVGGEANSYPTYVATLEGLQAALDAAEDGEIIALSADIKGDVVVTQKPDVKFTLDGNGHELFGSLTINGKSSAFATAGLTVKNVNFKTNASDLVFISLGFADDSNTRYTSNVNVINCTFDGPGVVGVKSYTGGDKNLTVSGCTVLANGHSLVQLAGVDNVKVENCKVYSKNGMNFNQCVNVEIVGCEASVKGYAVRFGAGSGTTVAAETYSISDCKLSSLCEETGDAVIILRGTAQDATLTISNTTISGTPDIINKTNAVVNR